MWIHGLFNQDFHRGRLASRWVTPAHELIAGKSISPSTHWANWVPVFVWDNGEGVPPYQLRPVRDTLWSVAAWPPPFQILRWASVLFVLPQLKYETQDIINWWRLYSSRTTRERMACYCGVFFTCFSVEFNFTIHSAVNDIYCKHGLLQESSCSNIVFVCKITYSCFWRNDTVCDSPASVLWVSEGCK